MVQISDLLCLDLRRNLVMFMGAVTMSQPMIVLSEFMDGGSFEDRYTQEQKVHGKHWR